MGENPDWELFHRDWRALLERYDLAYLRTTEAMSFRGAFESKRSLWGEQANAIRDQLLREALATIRGRLRFAGLAGDLGELPTDKEKNIRYRKNLMFQTFVRQLFRAIEPEVILALLCDDEQDAAIAYYQYVNKFKLANTDLSHRIAGICFFDDVRMAQLQAADLVAYILREDIERRQGRPTEPRSEWAEALNIGLGADGGPERMALTVTFKKLPETPS